MDQERLSSLDAFRGLTIAAMVLVNNPGSWEHVFPPLRHADWNGWTPTDLIFPFFLFIVGVSLAFSLSRRKDARQPERLIALKVLERSLVLFALGLFLQLFPDFHFQRMRIPGVLQRIAVCFFVAALLYLRAGVKERLGVVFVLLAGYWLALKLVPVPGYGAGVLEHQVNLPGYIDDKLLHGHLYEQAFDPEGILSTLPALATTLIGTLIGDLLRSTRTLSAKLRALFILGLVLTPLGLLGHRWMPINKKIWTSTFVIFTAGAALLLLAACFFLVEVLRWRKWAYPFLVFGTNPILIYAGAEIVAKFLGKVHLGTPGGRVSLVSYVYDRFLASWAGLNIGSLLWPIICLLVWFLLLLPLYKKRIFLRV